MFFIYFPTLLSDVFHDGGTAQGGLSPEKSPRRLMKRPAMKSPPRILFGSLRSLKRSIFRKEVARVESTKLCSFPINLRSEGRRSNMASYSTGAPNGAPVPKCRMIAVPEVSRERKPITVVSVLKKPDTISFRKLSA